MQVHRLVFYLTTHTNLTGASCKVVNVLTFLFNWFIDNRPFVHFS